MRTPEPEPTSKTCSVELRPAICSDRDEFLTEAAIADRIVVELDVPGPAERGRLSTFIQAGIERRLAERGAPPSGVGLSAGINASFCDQLYRARLLGAEGFALAFADLGAVADRSGILDADDSAAVRWWLKATESHPLQLLLPTSARDLRVYGAPTPLGEWLPGADTGLQRKAVIEWETDEPVDVALSASTEAMSLAEAFFRDEPVRATTTEPDRVHEEPSNISRTDAEPIDREPIDAPSMTAEPAPAAAERVAEVREVAEVGEIATAPTASDAAVDPETWETLREKEEEPIHEIAPSFALAGGMDFKIAFAGDAPVQVTPADLNDADLNDAAPHEVVSTEIEPPSVPSGAPTAASPGKERAASAAPKSARERELERQVESWMRELGSAQGPKPLSVIERLFVSAYVPLCHALADGVRVPEAREVMLEWSHSFESSYRPAFEALKKKGRRPTMVLDVPDVAARLGRLHGARNVQLLLVDGMRYDVGQAMRQSLKTLTAGTAACAEQLLLWSGLPTTTGGQLELIGRGPGGMADFTGSLDEGALVTHGPEARQIRRLRTGRHEMFKLDFVEDQISGPGPKLLTRIADLAEETAQLVATHMQSLPPRTLLMIFGDHGFQMEQRGNATKGSTQGGATPEEVFVPAYAWITENVH